MCHATFRSAIAALHCDYIMNKTFRFAQRARAWTWICVIATAMLGTAVLGILQFRWLGQLSESERETRQARLSADVRRLSEDFDHEITQAYFAFQLDGEALERRDMTSAAAHYKLWLGQAAFPHLIRDVWIAEPTDTSPTAGQGTTSWRFLRFDTRGERLVEATRPAGWRDPDTYDVAESPLDEDTLSIRIPVFSAPAMDIRGCKPSRASSKARTEASGFCRVPALNGWRPENLPVRWQTQHTILLPAYSTSKTAPTHAPFVPVGTPTQYLPVTRRFVIVRLDRPCMVNELLPALIRKYLGNSSPSGEPEYQVVIVRNNHPQETVYVSNLMSESSLPQSADATAGLLGIRPLARMAGLKTGWPVPQSADNGAVALSLPMSSSGELLGFSPKEYWKLQVTHRAGSLEAFAAQTRHRNILVSFVILVLLAGSLILALVAAHRARSLGRQQVEFVAGISHELRTPVTVMGVVAANLADGIVSEPQEVRTYGMHMQQEVRRLTDMLEHVLSYARVQTVKLPPREQVTPDVLIRAAVKSMQPQIEALGFTCTQQLDDTLPPVEVDRSSLERVVQNLISNALKYSGEQREVRIAAGKEASRTGVRVWIAVSDRGIGVPPDEQDLIFEPFRRGRAAIERSLPGTGLGLTLVLRIVQAHGGTIQVRSEPGKGSTFTLFLPAARTSTSGVVIG